jgi:HEAT repeat protein
VLSFGATAAIQALYAVWTVHAWIHDLSSPQASVREQALTALQDRNVETSPRLLELLRHPNADTRRFAASALNQLIPTPRPVIEAFLPIVADEQEQERVRWWAIFTFNRIGEHAHGPATETEAAIIAVLAEAVNSADAGIACSALSALHRFGPRAAGVKAAVAGALNRDSMRVRMDAAGTLMAIDPRECVAMLPLLLEGVRSDDEWISNTAIVYLGQLETKDAEAVIPLLQQIAIGDTSGAVCARDALQRMEIRTQLASDYRSQK